MTAAVSGISRLRNTSTNNRKLSSTTIPMNSGSLFERIWLKSAKIAVVPPTSTCSPVPCVAAGTTVSRTFCSRSEVETACGEPFG